MPSEKALNLPNAATLHYIRCYLLSAGQLVLLLKHFKSPQLSLNMLKRREADSNGDRSLDPVHTETFVEALDNTFSLCYVPQ